MLEGRRRRRRRRRERRCEGENGCIRLGKVIGEKRGTRVNTQQQ